MQATVLILLCLVASTLCAPKPLFGGLLDGLTGSGSAVNAPLNAALLAQNSNNKNLAPPCPSCQKNDANVAKCTDGNNNTGAPASQNGGQNSDGSVINAPANVAIGSSDSNNSNGVPASQGGAQNSDGSVLNLPVTLDALGIDNNNESVASAVLQQ